MKNTTVLVIAAVLVAWLLLKGKSVTASGFTASSQQLDAIVASGAAVGSPTYEAAVDGAYARAAAEAARTGGVVTWSSAKGYYVISQVEAMNPEYL